VINALCTSSCIITITFSNSSIFCVELQKAAPKEESVLEDENFADAMKRNILFETILIATKMIT